MYIKKTHQQYLFYQREGFEIQYSGLDEATGEKDYGMAWQQSKNTVFQTVIETQTPVKDGVLLCLKRKSGKRFTLHSQTFTLN